MKTEMSPQTFRLVLIVSSAHAMVHMFEHALPAVEQMIGAEFGVDKTATGGLGTIWRLPFGLGALLAGWLTDRWGAKRMLTFYLLGCVLTSVCVWKAPSMAVLYLVMFLMGTFASIYHPAGLALLSRETSLENHGAALGWHGIFGSLGIASAPFLASVVFSTGLVGWRGFYLVLTVPGLAIACLITRLHVNSERPQPTVPSEEVEESSVEEDPIPWRRFLLLVSAGAISGFVYAAFLQFLPRYLDKTTLRPEGWSRESFRNALATITLLFAAFGQGVAGRIAAPGKLNRQLVWIFFANVPPLLWMAFADGPSRLAAACLLAFIHFMNQPVYNSLIAELIPSAKRSSGYGFSNMVCFGIGAFGPVVAGLIESERILYASLGALAALAGSVALLQSFAARQDEEISRRQLQDF